MKIDWRSFKNKFVREVDKFPFGIRFYDAPQGGGKTLSIVHDAIELARCYPDLRIISNVIIRTPGVVMDYFETVDTLIELLEASQNEKHTLVIIDEALTYFAENGGIDPALMNKITQNRKCRRMIYLSTQKFKRVNNRLRDFSMETVFCNHLGFVQVNTVRDDTRLHWDKNEMDFVGDVKYRYIFKRNVKLFNAFDTFQSIKIDKNLNTTSLFSAPAPPPAQKEGKWWK